MIPAAETTLDIFKPLSQWRSVINRSTANVPATCRKGLALYSDERYVRIMARRLIAYTPTSTAKPGQTLKTGAFLLALGNIAHRKGVSSRQLRAAHVLNLADSIAALGLLEPLVVDTRGYILAGSHRLAALEVLAVPQVMERRRYFMRACGLPDDAQPKLEIRDLADKAAMLDHAAFRRRYAEGKVPVHVIEIPASEATSLPLAIEAAENAIRRQYTAEEVQALAARLKKAGYTSRNGRPKKGEKTIVTALESIIGRSPAQVRRLLRANEKKNGPTWQRAVESFARAASRIQRVAEEADSSAEAKAVLSAALAILRTPTGLRVWARRR